jgi:hypothetical protein
VQHPRVVRGREGGEDLVEERVYLMGRQRARGDEIGQRPPREAFHHDVGRSVMVAEVVYRNDVRVRQRCRCPGLVFEAAPDVGLRLEGGVHQLDGHRAVEAQVPTVADLGHPAGAQQLADPVASAEQFLAVRLHGVVPSSAAAVLSGEDESSVPSLGPVALNGFLVGGTHRPRISTARRSPNPRSSWH